ncbi:hypothetical protein EPN42_04810 [bacterium]|nr:MAG: hypothetical protein EPN42_04810 [bacterium]
MSTELTFDFTPPRRPARPLPSPRSGHTEEAYRADERRYRAWCALQACEPLAPQSVARYLTHLATTPPQPPDGKPRLIAVLPATHAYSTIRRRLAGIADAFARAEQPDPRRHPAVAKTMAAIARAVEHAQDEAEGVTAARAPQPKIPVDTDIVRMIVEAIDRRSATTPGAQLRALRDRALVLLLYSGAMSREEARRLHVRSIELVPEGLRATVNRSEFIKRARNVVILRGERELTDPIAALAKYLAAAGIEDAYVFPAVTNSGYVGTEPISVAQFARIVSDCVRAAGFDPRKFTPHAFRSGLIFQIGRAGGTLAQALSQTGHKEPKHVVRIFEEGRAWANHPGRYLQL